MGDINKNVKFHFFYDLSRLLVGLGNGILTSSVYIVEVVSPDNRGSVVMVSFESGEPDYLDPDPV